MTNLRILLPVLLVLCSNFVQTNSQLFSKSSFLLSQQSKSQFFNNNNKNNNLNSNDDFTLKALNDLLLKCSSEGNLEQCDVCSLCQNGAMCRQNSKKAQQNKPNRNNNNNNNNNNNITSIETLALLKSLVDFTCYCVPGFTGRYCQIDVNECLSQPCPHNATCIDLINTHDCKCPNGFRGEHCEININECESNPCSSLGGTCVDLIDGYFCQCNPGFTGPSCAVNIDECSSSPCTNNSTCVDLINGFKCECGESGYSGRHCEINIDDCRDVKCQNNATCIDGVNSFRCMCHHGYEGRFCEIDIDECKSSPCINGKCWQNSDERSFFKKLSPKKEPVDSSNLTSSTLEISIKYKFDFSRAAGYWCECLPGYTGQNCETKINECESNPCGMNGRCIDLINEFKCVCHAGYTGPTCAENINECELYAPCALNTRCIDVSPDYSKLTGITQENVYMPGYYCDCDDLNKSVFKSQGNFDILYAGQNCTTKLNACEHKKHLCKHGSTCKTVYSQNSSDHQDFKCLCGLGFTGKYCEFSTAFRMDGTYSIKQRLSLIETNTFSLSFDFKIKNKAFKNRATLPILYLESHNIKSDLLLFEIVLLEDHILIRNEWFNLTERLGFYNSGPNENLWHRIELKMLGENSYELKYSIKKLKLHALRYFSLLKSSKLPVNLKKFNPTSFTFGKAYSFQYKNLNMFELNSNMRTEYKNDNYLNNIFVRDFKLNEQILFKNDPKIDPNILNAIKFGYSNKINKNEANFVCAKNSSLIENWFNYECENCVWPRYGRKCQFESTKITFINKLNQNSQYMMSKNEALLTLNLMRLNSALKAELVPKWFKMSFELNRIAYAANSNQLLNQQPLYFLLLKQTTTNRADKTKFYYLLGITSTGHLNLRKLQTDYEINQFTYNLPSKDLWSLKNDQIDLNRFSNSYTNKISIKLSENLIELGINDTFMSRFELENTNSNSYQEKFFQIESLKFINFDSIIYLNDTFSLISNNYKTSKAFQFFNNLNFMIYDLNINENYYIFQNATSSNGLKLTLLDQNKNFLYETRDFFLANNLIVSNSSLNDFEMINYLNENYYGFCYTKQQLDMISGMQTMSQNISTHSDSSLIKSMIKKNCFQSFHLRPKTESFVNSFSPNKKTFSSLLKVNEFINITCIDNPNFSSNENNSLMYPKIERNTRFIQAKCNSRYSSIKRLLFNRESRTLSAPLVNQSPFINYFFAFENQDAIKDSHFYSFSFNLNMQSLIQSDYFKWLKNKSMIDFKTNLLTLNSFNNQEQKLLFLFGLNLIFKSNFRYEFEIFTSKQLIKTEPIELENANHINLTFTFNSIELRLNNYENSLIKLSDQYFNLFFKSLLKSQNSFQLNFTTYEYPVQTKLHNNDSDSSKYLLSACLSDFKVSTREFLNKTNSFIFTNHNLGEQTKSILLYQPNLFDNILFDSQCDNFDKEAFKSKTSLLSDPAQSKENCFLITKIDMQTHQEIIDYYDCNCSLSSKNECNFNFWTDGLKLLKNENSSKELASRTCSSSLDYACFNNGTCADTRDSYKCECSGPYSGERCEIYDPCLSNPCSTNSNCVAVQLELKKEEDDEEDKEDFFEENSESSYACECHDGYVGKNCMIKIEDTCLAQPCLNGATCLNLTYSDPDKLSFKCECALGYEGRRCEKLIDFCRTYEPCSNDAVCINQRPRHNELTFYECKCMPGWQGTNCTQDIDECAEMRKQSSHQEVCSGNGQCINTIGSFRCKCDDYHYGERCQHSHACQAIGPCRNGGVCLIDGSINENRYECKCPYGYVGHNCDFLTCDLQPCEHQSTCNMINMTQFECNCTNTGYAGVYCEHRINQTECHRMSCFGNLTCDPLRCDCSSLNCDEVYLQLRAKPRELIYHLVLWPLLGIMCTLLVILFSIFAMRVKKSRATRGTYSPSRHEQQASRIEFNMDLKRPPEERLI